MPNSTLRPVDATFDVAAAAARPWPDGIQRLARIAHRRLISLPSELAGWAAHRPAMLRRLRRTRVEAAARHAPCLPALSPQDAELVQSLRQDGVCMISLDTLGLPGTAAMLADADRLTERLRQRRHDPRHAHRHTITATAQDVLDFPAILAWGLNARLLDIVETYLGLPVAYDGCDHFYSPANGREAGPRLWHRDREDLRIVKVAVYIGDVDDDGGPFEIVHPDYADRLPGEGAFPALPHAGLEHRIGRAEMDRAVRSCTGPRGTVILAETGTNYHRGRPPVRTDRTTIYHSYFSRLSPTPFFGERSPLTRTDIARIAATLPARPRDALLWREALPAWQQRIPTNAVKV